MIDATRTSRETIDSRVDQTIARLEPAFRLYLTRVLPAPLVVGLIEFLVFGVKQAWACLFGGLMLAAIIATGVVAPPFGLARYDFLFLYAVGLQVLFLATGFERPREALIILMFHLVGTAMEVFKTHMGSWVYPEANLFRIGGVPLFSGFMYACVGSYLARVIRVHAFRFAHYPPLYMTWALAAVVYINFFSHHFAPDIRLALFAASAVLFFRTRVYFRVWRWRFSMPLLLGFILVSLFIWIAENVGTFAGAWAYPDQLAAWRPVSLHKMGAWYLLMIISWVLTTLVHPPRAGPACAVSPAPSARSAAVQS